MNSMRMMAMGLLAGSMLAVGCSGNWDVKRTDPAAKTDVDWRFNDEDARQTLAAMVTDCLSRPWISNWNTAHNNAQPIVFLGNVRNDTQDYAVNPKLFTDSIQRELINSGRVRVKAEKDARQELRDERLDTKYNDPATIKAVAKELNADFILVGNVQQSLQKTNSGGTLVNYYQVNMELTNVETAEKVWIGTKEIKKVATK